MTADIVILAVFVVCFVSVLLLVAALINNRAAPDLPLLFVMQHGRNVMADTLTYLVTATAPVDSDVVQRELVVTVNGEVVSTTVFAGSSVDFGTVTVPQDSEVKLTLVDVDDAGNKSQPAESYFVAVDTIPPGQPGAINVTLVGENQEPETPPVVDDNVAPPADEEAGS